MDMEPGDPFDTYRERVLEAVRHAEVVSLFFPQLGKALILDMRRCDADGPALLLDDMAASPRERLASFRRLRPGLPIPERLTLAAWGGHVRGLDDGGILGAILERCRLEGGDELVERARALYAGILALEAGARRDLVRGVGTRTLWQRPSADA
jgi:hypothetical protein